MQARIIEVRKGVLKKNDLLAHDLRARFAREGVFVVNLVSSPGAGKTSLLERTLAALAPAYGTGAVVGDLATDNDARRLSGTGARVHQITTGTTCHLEAEMIGAAIAGWDLGALDFLFIENVGNLVCPSSYDLGENLRVVLHSVTEGEDKPLKYPTIYNTADLVLITKIDLAEAVEADLVLITKIDLAEAVELDREEVYRNVQDIRPGVRVLECSARTGAGMDDWLAYLGSHLPAGVRVA